MTLNAYLNFNGKCKEAFEFYQKSLNGKNLMTIPFSGSPMASQVPPEAGDRIMHARMDVGDTVLMGSDGAGDCYKTPEGFAVSIGVDEPEEAERIFHALAEGASVRMPIQQTFWALRFAMLTDRYGTPWMINCEAKK